MLNVTVLRLALIWSTITILVTSNPDKQTNVLTEIEMNVYRATNASALPSFSADQIKSKRDQTLKIVQELLAMNVQSLDGRIQEWLNKNKNLLQNIVDKGETKANINGIVARIQELEALVSSLSTNKAQFSGRMVQFALIEVHNQLAQLEAIPRIVDKLKSDLTVDVNDYKMDEFPMDKKMKVKKNPTRFVFLF